MEQPRMTTQGTPEWKAARKGRITGSRIGAILGLSPWQTREDVLRAMVREHHGAASEFTGNIATNYGHANEGTARMTFELSTGLTVVDTGFHPHEDWAGASPDGLIGDDAVLEIKCPFKGIKKSLADQPHYYAQLQWEMLCTGRKKAYFYQWQPDDDTLNIVHQDQAWLDHALPEARQFYALYLHEIDNPEHLEPLRVTIETKEAALLVQELDDMRDAKSRAEERISEIMDRLCLMSNGKNATILGRRLTKVTKQGPISYSKAVKALMPNEDLSRFKSPDSEFWKFT